VVNLCIAFGGRLRERTAIGGTQVPDEDVTAELERLKRENEALREQSKAKPGQISLKVSAKGAVSVYGLGRFPVTLYQEQWLKLLDRSDEIRDFIRLNEGQLKKKEV